ncbi:hypothetical protein WJX84_001934 [Apatococcus fuscideae]|uniref:Uncharacterized protein n=1 Tax=Apatococcus fuscideae TaxID=2026836 RepID=A0AAW1SWG9_9CHLO
MLLARLEEPGGRLVLPALADLRLPLSTLSLLLPIIVPAGLIGWWVGMQRLSVANMTGIAAGICAAAGVGDLLSLVLWHPHSSLLPTLLWAAAGAALAHLAWRYQMGLHRAGHKLKKEGLGASSSLVARAAADTAWPSATSLDLESGSTGGRGAMEGGPPSAWLRADSWELLHQAEAHGAAAGRPGPGGTSMEDGPAHHRTFHPLSSAAADIFSSVAQPGAGSTSLGPDHPSKPSLPRSGGSPASPLSCPIVGLEAHAGGHLSQLSHLAASQHIPYSQSATILAALAAGGLLATSFSMLGPLAQQLVRGAVGAPRRAASQGVLNGTVLAASTYSLLGLGCLFSSSCLST